MVGELREISTLDGVITSNDKDLIDIVSLIKETLLSSGEGHYSAKQLVLFASLFTPEGIKHNLADRYFIVYQEGKEILGCGAVAKCEKYWEIKSVYVNPKMQSKGIGTLIMDHLENKSKQSGASYFYLESLNIPLSLNFYITRGYNVVNDLDHDINGENFRMVAMSKEI
ncbi:GNAT family N-acetyltransferase [Candidatus Woesearchaeota archaeon]|jgi:N-acetylglutamate synthase-like GNAT family acetyltransferase|nr:GNAT family N-acetyltransferase [Candidatus Woesearchaeota archaeon]MBT4111026.1 GNAT family N-acetyltransferase [Candidatus Woesearchaeota archaeon]MBT4336895.1 GNAT family N-acetyltransferase [Candidatus Woesearchaeota archaeon]MBT4469790.1 GNAT family N-acetyltransferase [Candidatus Woesearchaeota archaeon]MBT6743739.1 GNAT family N-acetyltransferase [Candidatus Woesearchaeota archaeon]